MIAVPTALVVVASTVAIATANAETGAAPSGSIRAESFSAQSGARLEGTLDVGGGQNVGWLANGDWLRYDHIDLGPSGLLTTTVRVAAATDRPGRVEVRADRQDGPLLASFTITNTRGWQNWVSLTQTSVAVGGSHDVFIVLRSDQEHDFVNINWFAFGAGAAAGATTVTAPPGPTPGLTTAAAASPTAPGSTASTGSTAPQTGWVAVDPIEQAAKTAAFFALAPKPVTGNPVKVPEFHAACLTSHHASDDPIVFPGLASASHNHTFFGNTTTSANSTAASLRAGTTNCRPAQDHSAYWVPTMYQNGKVIDPIEVTVYYGSRLKDPSRTQPFPFGLRMIVGDAKQQSDPNGNHFWCAGIGGSIGRSADGTFPVCASTAHIVRQVTFPDCWDGKHLDSPNHKDHMAWMTSAAVCPASHPVPIPSVSFVISYPLSANTDGITLASGTSYSMHADFFNAWEEAALAARVRNCLDQGYKCNADGNF